jgi:Protein of unknown function (DUF2950)
MSHLSSNCKLLTFGLWIVLVSCGTTVRPSAERAAPSAERTVPKTFASPSEAGAALLTAAQSGDRSAVLEIFGPDGAEILLRGDQSQDATNLRDFVTAYNRMNRWGQIKAGGQTLYIGPDNYAFPIPLGQNAAGRWYFDTAAGKDEVLARRIGNDELGAIAACDATARAQQQYLSQPHDGKAKQYAQKFVSDPGKQNGLYWPVADGQAASPLGKLGDFAKVAAANTGDRPLLFNGYYYRILTRLGDPQHGKTAGGFAILAYPAEYRNSGIMTFAVGKDGVVYQKDLGENTGNAALAMAEFNSSDGWTPAVPHSGTASRVQR